MGRFPSDDSDVRQGSQDQQYNECSGNLYDCRH